jgi:hypothetical protein
MAMLAVAACKPDASSRAARPAAPASARAPSELDRAFAAAFGQAPPAVRVVNRDGSGAATLRYRPLGLVELGDRTALVSGGWTDSCHGCYGALAVHYLQRTPSGFRLVGGWPEIVDGAAFGEPPEWSMRADLTPEPALQTRSGGTWQGCTVARADLVELTRDRPIVRVRNVLLDYDAENSGAEQDPAVHGELRAGDKGRTFSAEYTGEHRLSVLYVRNGDAYQPARAEPDLPSC